MTRTKILCAVLVVLASTAADAEQISTTPLKTPIRSVTPAPQAAQVPVAPQPSLQPKPLMSPIMMGQVAPPSLCVSIPMSVSQYSQKWTAANQAFVAAGSNMQMHFNAGKIDYFAHYIKSFCCSPNKSYTVQDQMAAGCSGSDTVAVCMDKLTRQCIRTKADSMNLRADLQKDRDALNQLSTTTGQLRDQLQSFQSLLP